MKYVCNPQKHVPAGQPQVGELYRRIRTKRVVRVVELIREGAADYVRVEDVETGRTSRSLASAWLKYPVLFARIS